MDPLHQADLANHIRALEGYLRLLKEARGELLESLRELTDATRKVRDDLEQSRIAFGQQSDGDDLDRSREA